MRIVVISFPIAVTVMALAAGCASAKHQDLVLDAVGPEPRQALMSDHKGTLEVFSAYDADAHFDGSPYRQYYTDYKVYGADGKFLRTVHNDSGRPLDGPAQLKLEAGNYRIVARSNRHGMVTVPVVIAADRLTTVHLEGGNAWPEEGTPPGTSLVRLPGGQVVGWRATDATATATATTGKDGKIPGAK